MLCFDALGNDGVQAHGSSVDLFGLHVPFFSDGEGKFFCWNEHFIFIESLEPMVVQLDAPVLVALAEWRV